MYDVALKIRIANIIKSFGRPTTIKEIADKIPDKPQSTIRGRLNENLDTLFQRVARGIYWITEKGILLIEGDGRDLSTFDDELFDCILADHPWKDDKSLKGTNRVFDKTYDTFEYELNDFKEKARVLKRGGFIVEVLPAENENNWKYLYKIKQMAEQCGLLYYSKVTWIKGTFLANTGRRQKNSEDILILSKGKARALRLDKKKIKAFGGTHYMSGTTEMLPAMFNIQAVPVKKRIHQAEKPVELYIQLIELLTRPGEIILDQFAGSGNVGVAALRTNRFACLIEILKENVLKIKDRIASEIEAPSIEAKLTF